MAYVFKRQERRTAGWMVAAALVVILSTLLVPQPLPQPPEGASTDATGAVRFNISAMIGEDIAIYGPGGGERCWDLPSTTSDTGIRVSPAFGYSKIRVAGETYYPVGVVAGTKIGMPHTIKCSSSQVLVAKVWLLNPSIILLMRIAAGVVAVLFGYVLVAGFVQQRRVTGAA